MTRDEPASGCVCGHARLLHSDEHGSAVGTGACFGTQRRPDVNGIYVHVACDCTAFRNEAVDDILERAALRVDAARDPSKYFRVGTFIALHCLSIDRAYQETLSHPLSGDAARDGQTLLLFASDELGALTEKLQERRAPWPALDRLELRLRNAFNEYAASVDLGEAW